MKRLLLLSALAAAAFIEAQESPVPRPQAGSANPLIGEWVHDIATLKKFYDSSELAKKSYKTWEDAKKAVQEGTDGIDITFTGDTMIYMRNGRKVVSYPYKLVQMEKNWIHIEYTHFLGAKRQMLFRLEGETLANHYVEPPRDWHPLRVYVRKRLN
jgi:hypothetical protein